MTGDELETLLRQWGRVYGERPPADDGDDRPVRAVHPIAVAMEFAPGKKVPRLDVALRRMIRKGERVWSRDPIVCTETRSSGARSTVGDNLDAERVQTAALRLRRVDPERGVVLYMQYCRRGSQQEKAEWMKTEGHPMSLRMYRERLAWARGWIEATLEARIAA